MKNQNINKFFYIRVSTEEQNEARQVEKAKELGIAEENIYIDKLSGKNLERPQWQELNSILRKGDTLIIQDLSRLSRTKADIKEVWDDLVKRGVDIEVLSMPLLNTAEYKNQQGVGNMIHTVVFEVISWMVEEERLRIKENQRQGIEIAKRLGKYKGRKRKYHKDAKGADKLVYDRVVSGLNAKETISSIAKTAGITRDTVYKIKKEIEEEKKEEEC